LSLSKPSDLASTRFLGFDTAGKAPAYSTGVRFALLAPVEPVETKRLGVNPLPWFRYGGKSTCLLNRRSLCTFSAG